MAREKRPRVKESKNRSDDYSIMQSGKDFSRIHVYSVGAYMKGLTRLMIKRRRLATIIYLHYLIMTFRRYRNIYITTDEFSANYGHSHVIWFSSNRVPR